MRRILQHIVIPRLLPLHHLLRLLPNFNHRIAEPINLLQTLALRRLDEHARRDRPRARRRVEAVVLQPLREVHDLQPRALVEVREVDEQLVRDAALVVLVAEIVVPGEARGHVVGIEEGDLGGLGEALAAEHLDVGPGDQQNRRAAKGRGRDGVDVLARVVEDVVGGKERSKVLGNADGA